MIKLSQNKFLLAVSFLLMFTFIFASMSLMVFADGASSDAPVGPVKQWWNDYNHIVGYVIAGIIAVAGISGIILWIPKENKKSGKRTSKK